MLDVIYTYTLYWYSWFFYEIEIGISKLFKFYFVIFEQLFANCLFNANIYHTTNLTARNKINILDSPNKGI